MGACGTGSEERFFVYLRDRYARFLLGDEVIVR